jgi:hypothetical protein
MNTAHAGLLKPERQQLGLLLLVKEGAQCDGGRRVFLMCHALFATRIDFRHRKNGPFRAIPSKRTATTSLRSDLERRRTRRPSEASIIAPLRRRGIA